MTADSMSFCRSAMTSKYQYLGSYPYARTTKNGPHRVLREMGHVWSAH